MFGWVQAAAQNPTKQRQDTISLSRFEFTQGVTNNGSDCIYYISNPSYANVVVAVTIGAPDSMRLDDHSLFNGIHQLAPGGQLISVGNFAGKQLSTINLSATNTPLTVMLFCPGN